MKLNFIFVLAPLGISLDECAAYRFNRFGKINTASFMRVPSRNLVTNARVYSEDEAPLTSTIGSKYRVVCGSHAMLNVYSEPGDPYGKVLHHLRHGDEVVATDFMNFAGQTWVQHLVFKGHSKSWEGTLRDSFLGWSPQDLAGNRNLQCMGVFELGDASLDALHSQREVIRLTAADDAEEEGRTVPAAPAQAHSAHADPCGLALHAVDVGPGGYDAHNLYAQLIRRELPSPPHVLLETDAALAVLETAHPAAPFHCLLLPKVPTCDLRDLAADYAAAFLRELPRLVAAVKHASGAPAVHVLNTCGRVGYPKSFVPHTHFDIVPCFSTEDAIRLVSGEEPSQPPLSAETLAQQASILRGLI